MLPKCCARAPCLPTAALVLGCRRLGPCRPIVLSPRGCARGDKAPLHVTAPRVERDSAERALRRLTSHRRCKRLLHAKTSLQTAGRPGKAQLAGLRPGDELSHLHPEPGVCLEAGLLSREGIDRELSRLAAWSRSRKITAGRRKPRLRRVLKENGGGDGRGSAVGGEGPAGDTNETGEAGEAAVAAAGGDAGGDTRVYEEADFPWKLEFRRQRRRPEVGGAAREEGVQPAGGQGEGASPKVRACVEERASKDRGGFLAG